MTSVLVQMTIDVQDVARMATIWLQPSAGPKATKNRTHLDLRPADGDVDGEVRRLVDLGISRSGRGARGQDQRPGDRPPPPQPTLDEHLRGGPSSTALTGLVGADDLPGGPVGEDDMPR